MKRLLSCEFNFDTIAYADLILNGNLEAYLKAVTEYKMLD